MLGEIFSAIYMTLVSALSLVFFLGVAAYIMFQSHSRWRDFEAVYSARKRGKAKARKTTGMIRISQPGHRWGQLSGDIKSQRYPPVKVSVYAEGLRLSIVPPFKYGCQDIFLPFDQMTVTHSKWAMVSGTYGVRMQGVEGLEILMYSEILQWASRGSSELKSMLDEADLERAGQTA